MESASKEGRSCFTKTITANISLKNELLNQAEADQLLPYLIK